jgi:hypothetical protein
MKKIDLSKIEYENIDGSKATIDAKAGIANQIYMSAHDIGVMEWARELYHSEGEYEFDDHQMELVMNVVNSMPAVYREPIKKKLLS